MLTLWLTLREDFDLDDLGFHAWLDGVSGWGSETDEARCFGHLSRLGLAVPEEVSSHDERMIRRLRG